MRLDQKVAVGSVVYLRPTLRSAPRECYQNLPASVVGYERWPHVTVRIEIKGAEPYELDVHADNVALHPPKTAASAGDSATGRETRATRRKPAQRTAQLPPLALGPGDEELTLW